MQNRIAAITLLIALTIPSQPSFAQDDWQVTTSASAKLAYKHRGLYSGIKTQEAWDQEFKKVFEKGDVAASRFLIIHAKKLELKFDVNALLHKAVTLKTSAMTQMLIAQGADPTAKDSSGNQALHLAVKSLSVKNVELLLKRPDVNVDAENAQGERAIGLAAASTNEQVIKQVLKKKPNLDFKLWGTQFKEWVFKKDNVEGFKLFYPNLNAKKLPIDDEGQTVLHKAAKYDAARITSYLLKKGANAHVLAGKALTSSKEEHRKTPFDYAVANGHVKTIRTYLEYDRKFVGYREPKSRDTLLHIAFETSNWELADLILKFKPQFYQANQRGEFLGDTLQRVKNDSDPKDAELANNIARYEPVLANKKATMANLSERVLKYNDQGVFDTYVKEASRDDVLELFTTMLLPEPTHKNKLSLFKRLLKSARQHFSSKEPSWIYSTSPYIFHPENFQYFKAIYDTFGPSGLYQCTNQDCPFAEAWTIGGPKFAKLLSTLKPPPSFNATANSVEWGALHNESYLDRLDNQIRKLKTSNSNYRSEIKRLEEVRAALVAQGALTIGEQDLILEKASLLIKAGRGKELLKKYKPEQLAHLAKGAILLHAVLYNDDVLLKALLPHNSKQFNLPTAGTLAEPEIKKILTKAEIPVDAPINCSEYLNHFLYHGEEPIHREQLLKTIKRTQLALCHDTTDILLNAISNQSEPLVEALLELPPIKTAIRAPGKILPLHAAIKKCAGPIIKKLLAAGADPNVDHYGEGTPLVALSTRQECQNPSQLSGLVAEFVKAGADVNGSIAWRTPLVMAVAEGKLDIFKELIDAGATLYPKNLNQLHKPMSASEQIAFEKDAGKQQPFWDYLYEKDINPVAIRPCYRWDAVNSTVENNNFFDALNRESLRFRKKQKSAQSVASCENLKAEIETQYTHDVLVFSQHVAKWKFVANMFSYELSADPDYGFDVDVERFESLKLSRDKAQKDISFDALCCGFAANERCNSQLVCGDRMQDRESSAVFCDRFADTPLKLREMGLQFEHVKFKDLSSENQSLITKHGLEKPPTLHIALTNELGSPDTKTFELVIPFQINDNKVVEKIVDEQIPSLYAKMGLDSLHSYVSWKYPHCSTLFSVDAKVSTDKFNKTISPQKVDPNKSTKSEGTNAK